jgi:hypothetical protein
MQLHDGRPDVGAEHLQWEAPPQFCRHTAASQYAPVQPKPVVASNWHEHTGGGLTTEQVPCAAQRASARQYSVQVEPTKTKPGAHAVFVLGVHEGPTRTESPDDASPDVHAGVRTYTPLEEVPSGDVKPPSKLPVRVSTDVRSIWRGPEPRVIVTEPRIQSVELGAGHDRMHAAHVRGADTIQPEPHTLRAHVLCHGRKRWSITLINHPTVAIEVHSTGCAPAGTVAVESNAKPTVRLKASFTAPSKMMRS